MASLDDAHGLLDASLVGNLRRAIDVHESDPVDGDAFKSFVQPAVALNMATVRRR